MASNLFLIGFATLKLQRYKSYAGVAWKCLFTP